MTTSEDARLSAMIELPEKTYFKIGEVAKLLEVEPYVLRYWETEFEALAPEKTRSGQRVYQRDDIRLLLQIRALLYEEMFTIAGARRQLELASQGKSNFLERMQQSERIERGTALADNEELHEQLESARQELVAAQSELNQADEELDAAQATLGSRREELSLLRAQVEEGPDAQEEEALIQLQDQLSQLQGLLDQERANAQSQAADLKVAQEKEGHRRQALKSLRRHVEALALLAEPQNSRR